MQANIAQVERVAGLGRLQPKGCSPHLKILHAVYRRQIPSHYAQNPLIRAIVELNVIMLESGQLIMPASPRTTFFDFYTELRKTAPAVFRQILAPSGAAKSTSCEEFTPIKQIAQLSLSGRTLPGDAQSYGWDDLSHEADRQGLRIELLFQVNGLYFNRGSVYFDGQELHAYPDAFLAELLEAGLPDEEIERLAVSETSLKRPLLLFAFYDTGPASPILHTFFPQETYRQGMARLRKELSVRRVRSAVSASPPLVLPDEPNGPNYLTLTESLSRFAANDVRHYLFCPYEGAALLWTELGRAQSLRPEALAASLSNDFTQMIDLELAETICLFKLDELTQILERNGYGGRFIFSNAGGKTILSIKPLEGVYSHLVLFLTRQGRFGLIQTSGTRGNITGNDGPTYNQMQSILRDLNEQSFFSGDPIIAAASGCQGNDVPNVLFRREDGQPGLLYSLSKQLELDESPALRGIVTTPRVGLGRRKYV